MIFAGRGKTSLKRGFSPSLHPPSFPETLQIAEVICMSEKNKNGGKSIEQKKSRTPITDSLIGVIPFDVDEDKIREERIQTRYFKNNSDKP